MKRLTKGEFRKDCIKKLKFYSKIGKIKKDKSIVKNILKIIVQENKTENKKNILLYIPLKMEVNIFPLIHHLRKIGFNVYVPYMVGKSLKIVPFRYPLEIKQYKIKEPKNSYRGKRVKIDIAVVPIVGYDNTLRRIGFGAGFYDRYFSTIKKKPKIIFTQLYDCESKKTLTEQHDITGDYIITNKGIKYE